MLVASNKCVQPTHTNILKYSKSWKFEEAKL